MSSPSNPTGSKKAVQASSKDTPCFASLTAAFRWSHSNTDFCIYQIDCPRKSNVLAALRSTSDGSGPLYLFGSRKPAPDGMDEHGSCRHSGQKNWASRYTAALRRHREAGL